LEMFCPKCKSLLLPKDGVLTCSKCGHKNVGEKKESCVTKKREKEAPPILDGNAGMLPTTDAECSKCGNRKAYWVLRQTRAADEPETRIMRCTKCSHSWREY